MLKETQTKVEEEAATRRDYCITDVKPKQQQQQAKM